MQLCVSVLVICPLFAATHNLAERWTLKWTAPARAWQDHLFAERRNAAKGGAAILPEHGSNGRKITM